MRFVGYRLFAIFVLSLLTLETSSAAGAYLGGGVSRFSLSSSNSAIDGRAANGVTIFAGVEFASTWSAELAISAAPEIDTGPTQNIFYPADSAEYSILRASIRAGSEAGSEAGRSRGPKPPKPGRANATC
jgi:hypothetical protein